MKKIVTLLIPSIVLIAACNPFITKHDVYEAEASLEKDEPVHLKNSLEWWYFTGHLSGDDGNEYGIEYVFFHFTPPSGKSTYMINFAISDPQNEVFYYEYDFFSSRQTPEAGVLPLDLVKGPYSLKGEKGSYVISAEMQNYPVAIKLRTEELRPPVFQNGTGYEQYGNLATAGYFSYPRLATRGQFVIKGDTIEVSGETWYDRQWNCGSNLISGKVSWDWISVQFNEAQEELMVYRVEDRKTDTQLFGGSFHRADGTIVELEDGAIKMTPMAFWKSPDTKRNYPFKWRVEVPSLELDVEVEASFPHQELVLSRFGIKLPYWEGMCKVEGQMGEETRTGNAYLEMTNRRK